MARFERWCAGLAAGLVLALAALFFASTFGLRITQTGSSLGHGLFLLLVVVGLVHGWLAPVERTIGRALAAAGVLALCAGAVSVVRAPGLGGYEVTFGLATAGVGLCLLGRRVLRLALKVQHAG
jgi:hypothetical protein